MRPGQLGDTRGVIVSLVISQLIFDAANLRFQHADPIFHTGHR